MGQRYGGRNERAVQMISSFKLFVQDKFMIRDESDFKGSC
jgi:hypothetical protein